MLTEIGSIDNVAGVHRGREGRQGPAQGFGHRVVQELRPAGHDHQADRRRGVRDHRQEPAARHRPRSSRRWRCPTTTSSRASSTRTSTSTRASSTRRWASRSRCSPCCSPSPAPPGWLAHWVELLEQDQKIARPRQLYTGADVRDYVAHRPARADAPCTRSRSSTAPSSGASTPIPSPAPARCWSRCGPPGSTAPTASRSPASTRPRPARPPTSPGWSWPARWSRSGPARRASPSATASWRSSAAAARPSGSWSTSGTCHPGARRRAVGRRPAAFPEAFTTAHDALFTQCGLPMGERLLRPRRRRRGRHRRRCSSASRPAPAWSPPCATRPSGRASRRSPPGCRAIAPEGFARARALRRGARAGRRAEPARRPRGARHRRAHLGDRRRRRRQGRGQPARADGQAGRIHGSTLRARPLEQKADAARRVESATCSRCSRTAALRVPVHATFPMAEAAAAYEQFAAGGKLGKIVLARLTPVGSPAMDFELPPELRALQEEALDVGRGGRRAGRRSPRTPGSPPPTAPSRWSSASAAGSG